MLTKLFGIRDLRPAGKPEIGISKGRKIGEIGLWLVWDHNAHPMEVFRVLVKPYGFERNCPDFSMTFAPSFQEPFWVALETPQEFREFLRGAKRARNGSVTFEFVTSSGHLISETFDLADILNCYQMSDGEVPELATVSEATLAGDSREVAAIPAASLKAYSDKVRQDLAEKKRLAEEEAKRKEEERKKAEEAAKAAASAKAAQEAAKKAAASAGGGGAAAPVAIGPALSGKVAILYGTTTGNTGNVAEMIKSELGGIECKSITDVPPSDFTIPETLILGVPTWHIGEMQDDWAVILPEVAKQNFAGKKVAIFGLGDGKGYPDTYVDAMGELWDKLEARGAKLYGLWPTEGYEFQKSKGIRNGKFIGLVIDIENQHEQTDDRVKRWAAQIKKEMAI